jgi:hypothetical protein
VNHGSQALFLWELGMEFAIARRVPVGWHETCKCRKVLTKLYFFGALTCGAFGLRMILTRGIK